ncbi:MAG: ComF family protein [Erythrobacter sp.]
MRWRSFIKDSLRPVVDLVYPPRCPLCGDAIADQSGVCVSCWSELSIPSGAACASCGLPFGSEISGEKLQCGACVADPPRHSGIITATLYNDASRKLVLSLKHGHKIALAPLLARLIASRFDVGESQDRSILVPVPLHRWRLWKRGFNQAGLIAQELAPLIKAELVIDGLVRQKQTPSLGGLGSRARHKVLSGAIRLNPSVTARIKGRDIILVDDVLTSGATSDACVRALITGGARSVKIACFARVVGTDLATQSSGQSSVTGARAEA